MREAEFNLKGKIINAPLSFKSELPIDIHLDGELWYGDSLLIIVHHCSSLL
jgi:hypothetical protein